MKFRALLIDVDGTAVDCEPRNRGVIEDIARDAGYEITADDWKVFAGTSHEFIWENLCERSESFATFFDKAHKFEKMCEAGYIARSDEVEANHVVKQIVQEFIDNKDDVVAVSNSNHAHVEHSLALTGYPIAGLKDIFGKDDIKSMGLYPKPESDPYHVGLDRINLDIHDHTITLTPQDCLILEDSKTGVRAALQFGATVIQITDYNLPLDEQEVAELIKEFGGTYITATTDTLYEAYQNLQNDTPEP